MIRELPEKVEDRCAAWFRHFKFWRRFFFTTGTIGAIFSALAATQLAQKYPSGAYLAVGASICFAVLGFTHPERNYFQYVRAWRVLDVACQRYKYYHGFTIEQLLDAVQHGEQIIAEVEHAAEEERKRHPDTRQQSKSFAGKNPR
ncbi:MAG TPA: DUF1772 domain-containing protein [Candidatus Udaeobacter sp.]